MGRSLPPHPDPARDRLPPRQPEGRPVRVDRAIRAVDEVAEEVIGGWLDANPQAVTANQVATGINWTADSRSIYRITTVLKQLGYTRPGSLGMAAKTGCGPPRGGAAQLEL